MSYIIQRGAEALYSPDGKAQVRGLIEHYLGNAKVLRDGAKKAGLKVFGGVNAPYIWVRAPRGVTSWQVFDKILDEETWSSRPAADSARRAKAISASAPSTAAPMPRKSRAGCGN